MKIAVSIVEFNTKDLLKKCLHSVFNQRKLSGNDIVVWVVDNNSKDRSVEMVESEFHEVRLIKNSSNEGFAKGQNTALKKIMESGSDKADFALILNSDAQISSDAIFKMVEFMDQNPDCGIASCQVTGSKGELQPNGGDLPFGLALFSWLFNLEILGNLPNFHRNERDYYKTAHEVGWVSGSFMMVRKAVFEKIGYLNEDYLMYFEDVEFCFKAKKERFKVMINPEVVIRHVGGASSKDPRLRQWRGEMKGLIYFYTKQFNPLIGLLVKILIYLSLFLRIIIFSLTGKFHFASTYGKIVFTI